MKLRTRLLALTLSIGVALPVALALVSGTKAHASATRASVAVSTWTVTGGPTTGTKPFPGGTVPSVSWTGKIDPPLGAGVTAGICSVVFVCPGTNQVVDIGNVMGGAQGASFTIDIKQSALTGTHCSKELKVCFCGDLLGEECVILRSPTAFAVPVIDFGGLVRLPQYEVPVAVQVLDRFGAVNESYYGEVVIAAHSESGGVKLNGSWGKGVVDISAGVGELLIDATRATSGALVTFDLSAERTDSYRTSIQVQ